MRSLRVLVLIVGFFPCVPAHAQTASLPASSFPADVDRSVSLKQLPGNIIEDQKRIWLAPVGLFHGEHIFPAVALIVPTAAFIATDAHAAPPFRTSNSNTLDKFNDTFSSWNSAAMIAIVPAALYGVGFLHGDSYAQQSALLAAEAAVDGFLVDMPIKAITARRQPLTYFGNGPYTNSFFHASHSPVRSGGFFSDHANAATAVATVIAHRYRQHRWVPYAAYGLAGVISFARVTTSSHFPADAFFGGAMGFMIARYAVLPAR
jgi:hypothetical protein